MPTIVDLGRAAKQAHPEYNDVDDAELGRAVQKASPGAYDEFTEPTTAGTGRTGARLKGTPSGGSPILPMATATMIGGPILGEAAGLIPLGRAATTSAAPASTPPTLPEIGPVGRFVSHMVPGGRVALRAYDALKSMIPEVEGPQAPTPFRPNPNIMRTTQFKGPTEPNLQPGTIIPRKGWAGPPPEIPPVEEPAPQAPTPFKPNPNIARRMKFGGSTSPNFSAPSGPIKTGKVTGGAAPPIEPIGSKTPVTVPSETLPSRDWRFEDARDMARLLNQHGIDPTDMGDEEWNIAAPALKRNLGVPNARAKNMVTQEWNKLQGAQ